MFSIMQFFTYEHLPPRLQVISKPFCELAVGIQNMEVPVVGNSQQLEALEKLLEAKDCAVRAALYKE